MYIFYLPGGSKYEIYKMTTVVLMLILNSLPFSKFKIYNMRLTSFFNPTLYFDFQIFLSSF